MLAESRLLEIIERRHSTRTPFDPEHKVDGGSVARVVEAARWAPTAHNMQNFEILAVDDPETIRKLGEVTSRVSAAFLWENYRQLSFTVGELEQKRTGVLGSAFPPAWRDPSKFESLARDMPPVPLSQSINGSPLLLLVVYDPEKRAPDSVADALGMVSLGCVMENMWLMAEAEGLSCQVLSLFAGEEVGQEVKRVLQIPPKLRIAFAMRMGYPLGWATQPPRVRRAAEEIVHYNRYGGKGGRAL